MTAYIVTYHHDTISGGFSSWVIGAYSKHSDAIYAMKKNIQEDFFQKKGDKYECYESRGDRWCKLIDFDNTSRDNQNRSEIVFFII